MNIHIPFQHALLVGMVLIVPPDVLQDAGIHVIIKMEDVRVVNLDTQETSVTKVNITKTLVPDCIVLFFICK